MRAVYTLYTFPTAVREVYIHFSKMRDKKPLAAVLPYVTPPVSGD